MFFRNGDDEAQFDKLNSGKVDKVTGKGLSTNDFTNELKATLEEIAANYITKSVNDLANYYNKNDVNGLLDKKLDKVDCPIIETITLEEEVASIKRNYTINQNFTDCIVLIEFPQVPTNITFSAAISTNTYYPCCNAYYNNGISASGNRCYQIHSNIINGYRRTTSRQGTRNDKDDMHGETVWDFSDLYLYPERFQKITKISVNGISENLPIGTKVTILGNKEQQ